LAIGEFLAAIALFMLNFGWAFVVVLAEWQQASIKRQMAEEHRYADD